MMIQRGQKPISNKAKRVREEYEREKLWLDQLEWIFEKQEQTWTMGLKNNERLLIEMENDVAAMKKLILDKTEINNSNAD